MSNSAARKAIFISHANPEDNAFARWLGAKLSAMGFEVWADVMRLHGGADWARELEGALRIRAAKMLLVANPAALEKQGVRNEIQIGSEVAKELDDSSFIIPLRLAPYKAPFQIVQSQYIDFCGGWAIGLAELVDTLINVYKLQPGPCGSMDAWLAAQSVGGTTIITKAEGLTSNWLQFAEMPRLIRYFEPPTGFPLERFHDRTVHQWPMVAHGAGLLTFATVNEAGFISTDLPATCKATLKLEHFLGKGWPELAITQFDARNRFSDLANQAFERFLQSRGLSAYAGSGGRLTWWPNIKTAPLAKVRFNWLGQVGSRQIIGQSAKRGVHWHYAINGHARSAPIRHFRIYTRLIFSQNGLDPLNDPRKMHSLRRSFAKWRNARWRDMLLAFLWWLASGKSDVQLPLSNDQKLRLTLPTLRFRSPVSVHDDDDDPDEDDPDIEDEYWEDEFPEESTEGTEREYRSAVPDEGQA